ncbi:MAG: metallophosphoesterase family protein [bacterium]
MVHLSDFHYWYITGSIKQLINKRVLGTFNLIINRAREFDHEKDFLLIRKIKEIKNEDIIITGDFTSTSLDREYQRAMRFIQSLSDSGSAIFVIPGNHDRYTFESAKERRFEKYFNRWQISPGKSVQSKDRGTYFLILLDQAWPNFISSRGGMSQKALYEISEVLNTIDTSEIPIIIAGHYPLLKSTPYYTMSWQRDMKNAGRLRNILGHSEKTIFYLCGHVHKQYCLEDPLYPNIMYISCGAPFSRKNGRKMLKFNEITINEKEWCIDSHYFDGKWCRENIFYRVIQ